MTVPLIILAVLAAVVLSIASLYNKLQRLRKMVRESFAAVDAHLKKRYDLIPHWVETLKTSMLQEPEQELLEEITTLRSRGVQPNLSPEQAMNLDQKMSQKLQQLHHQVDRYPDLETDQKFLQLSQTLHEIESHLATSRQRHNRIISYYNSQIQIFPTVLLAGILGIVPEPFFTTPDMIGYHEKPDGFIHPIH